MNQIAVNYGGALYALAKEETLETEILQELSVLQESFSQEPGFLQLLASPNLTKQERCGVLDDGFREKLHIYVLNFLKILTEKGHVRHFSQCVDAYKELYNQDKGILVVEAVTAVPLTPEQQAMLCDKLEKTTGKTINLHNRIDPATLGGVRLDYDGKRVEDTVSNRLDAIRKVLKNTVL